METYPFKLTPGVVYKFVFLPGYEQSNGVFRLVKLMTYEEYVEDGHDILSDFFKVNGKTQEDVDKEMDLIRGSQMAKLVIPDTLEDDPEGVYVPISFLKEVPDHNVRKYYALGVISMLGITKEPQDLAYAQDTIKQIFEAALGVTPDPKFVTTREVWLTDGEYQEELGKRDLAKMKVLNYFSENTRLEKEISQLKTKLQAYEEIVLKLNQQVQSRANTEAADG